MEPWEKGADDARSNDQTITYRIYCCGEVTEVEYFSRYNVQGKLKITCIHGSGRNHQSLVDFMIDDLYKEGLITVTENGLQINNPTELKIWCVFDRDFSSFKNDELSYMKALAYHKNGPVNIAWSNDSFEVWFLLHLQYFDNITHRDQLYDELDKHFQGILYKDYRKGRADTRSFISQILPNTQNAIDRAKLLYAFHAGKPEIQKNPSTKVFELIEEFQALLGSDFPLK